MPGIGPWTADYVRMRVLGDPDVFLPGDVAVRAGAAAIGIPSDPTDLTEWAARTAPWRSYLTAHLWRAVPPRRAPNSGSPVTRRPQNRRNPAVQPAATARQPEFGTQRPNETDKESA